MLFDNSYSYLTTKKIRYSVYITEPIEDVGEEMWREGRWLGNIETIIRNVKRIMANTGDNKYIYVFW